MSQLTASNAALRAAEVYEQFFVANIFRYWTPIFLKRLKPKPGESVLDVACGTGVAARTTVPMVKPAGRVAGLDVNPAMLEVACSQFSQYCDEIDWYDGRAEELPFDEGEFDLVLCQQGLQFFKDRAAAAREMHCVLRPGGRVGIAVWRSLPDNLLYRDFHTSVAEVFKVPLEVLTQAFSFGDPEALENLLVEAGFRQVRVERVRDFAYFQSPDSFVELTIQAVSAAIPSFTAMDAETQDSAISEVKKRVKGLLSMHLVDGVLTIPLQANIAQAIR
jgi:ubiquinone/menaquinone biosynthesis C-methylase UbiE